MIYIFEFKDRRVYAAWKDHSVSPEQARREIESALSQDGIEGEVVDHEILSVGDYWYPRAEPEYVYQVDRDDDESMAELVKRLFGNCRFKLVMLVPKIGGVYRVDTVKIEQVRRKPFVLSHSQQ